MRFVRSDSQRVPRLGKGRRKLQKWRKARGRHNKVREKRRGRAAKVEIGFRSNKKTRGLIEGKSRIFLRNMKDIGKIKKNDVVIIANIGKKKRIEMEKKINEIGAKILNERRKNESKK